MENNERGLAIRLTDGLIDGIEGVEREIDDLRALLRSCRGMLGSSQIGLMEAELATLTALFQIRLNRFTELASVKPAKKKE